MPRCRTWKGSTTRLTCISSGPGSRFSRGSRAYADAGVTDFRLEVAAHDPDAREATRAALAGHLGEAT